ncbi:MAG TPA: hypothetical protein GX012_00070, partial [Acholeplasma sp.]|nr:hypothetical protein [Acholeplasma sp.]
MRNIFTIIKKELRRFFTDKRMVASLILPGILIFALYTLMGNFMNDMISVEDDYRYTAVVVNYDPSLNPYFPDLNDDIFDITYIDSQVENNLDLIRDEALDNIRDEELDLYVIFPVNFYQESIDYDPIH